MSCDIHLSVSQLWVFYSVKEKKENSFVAVRSKQYLFLIQVERSILKKRICAFVTKTDIHVPWYVLMRNTVEFLYAYSSSLRKVAGSKVTEKDTIKLWWPVIKSQKKVSDIINQLVTGKAWAVHGDDDDDD